MNNTSHIWNLPWHSFQRRLAANSPSGLAAKTVLSATGTGSWLARARSLSMPSVSEQYRTPVER